jgi:cellulose synthase operon protein B
MRIKRIIQIVATALGLALSSITGAATSDPEHLIKSEVGDFPIVTERIIQFSQLGYNGSISMLGSESNAYIGFGSRLDEVISKGMLSFDFTPSPALRSLVSHLKVYLNNELMGVISINDGDQGKKINADIPLDPRFFSNFNQLHIEFIGDTEGLCANPNHPSIWTEISQSSHIALQVQKTVLKSDLNLLPAPFFDERDFSQVNIPFVMGKNYDLSEVKAAGVLASYFGVLSDWRGARFPISLDELPQENAIVFVINTNKPAFLQDFPDADKPTLQMISHPENPYIKLLLIIGRDSKDLNDAVMGLTLGNKILTGPIATINDVKQISPRRPYDAPNWVSTLRPIALSELIKNVQDLQVEGRTPPPISVNFRLAPDLFTWQSRGIPLDLMYRYSPPSEENSGSRMSLSINSQFIEAFNLKMEGEGGKSKRIRVPLLDDGLLGLGDQVRIPAFKVGSNNEIEFEFGFASMTEGMCQSSQPSKQYAVIQADSTIDFSGFPHYIEMPNLRAFANSGFPFTRMADLSETVAIVPKNAPIEALQTFINVMGVIGSESGYPAIRVELIDTWAEEQLKDKDILSIGVVPELQEAASDKNEVNLVLQAGERLIRLPVKNEQEANLNWVLDVEDVQVVSDVISVRSEGAFAAITGSESPFTQNRSLVSLLAANSADFSLIDEALLDSGKIAHMFGSVVTLRNNEVASFNVGDHYFVGELPIWQLIWYHFSNRPVLLAFISAFLVVIITIVLWRLLRTVARKRLETDEDDV